MCKDARGNRTSFQYDNAGRLKQQQDPLGNLATYLYDLAGRNTTLIDAKGNVKTMVFDAIGELVTILYADGTRVTIQFDPLGRMTTMIDAGGTTTLQYDSRSSLIGKTVPGGFVPGQDLGHIARVRVDAAQDEEAGSPDQGADRHRQPRPDRHRERSEPARQREHDRRDGQQRSAGAKSTELRRSPPGCARSLGSLRCR